MAYRNDLEALQARHNTLEAEVATLTRKRDEVAQLLTEARAREQAEREQADRLAGGPARRRRYRRILSITSVAALVFAGGVSGYRRAQTERDGMAEMVAQMTRFTDEACGCATAACARQVMDNMAKWGATTAKHSDVRSRPDVESLKRVRELSDRLTGCLTKAMLSEARLAP
jgi:hypothetical protein